MIKKQLFKIYAGLLCFFCMKKEVLKKGKARFFVLIETLIIYLSFNANILSDLNDRDGINYAKNCPTISEGRIRS
jgi:hypothetical protein